MTVENSKRLYEHYIKIGKDDAAANMLVKYPQFKKAEPVKVEVKKEEIKKSN